MSSKPDRRWIGICFTCVAGSETGSRFGSVVGSVVGSGSEVGAETSLKFGSGVGSETNYFGSTTLLCHRKPGLDPDSPESLDPNRPTHAVLLLYTCTHCNTKKRNKWYWHECDSSPGTDGDESQLARLPVREGGSGHAAVQQLTHSLVRPAAYNKLKSIR